METNNQINNNTTNFGEGDSQVHIRFLENLDRVNKAMQGTNDLERMMKDTLETVRSIFDSDRVWLLYACDPNASSFRVPMEVFKPQYPGANVLNVDVPMSPDVAQNMGEALSVHAPVTYAEGTERPINKMTAEQFGVRSQMFTAIYPKSGKPWAFGMHQCSSARIWTTEEQELFQEIGRRLSDSLSLLLMYRDTQESERHYRSLFEHMLTGVATCRMLFDESGKPSDFVYLEVNESFETLTGLKDVIGKKVTEVIPGIKESSPELFETYGRVASTGVSEKLEIYLSPLKIWFLVSVYSTEKGFFTAVFDNITEDKNREEQLAKSVTEMRNLMDTIPQVLYVLDTESNIIKWNKKAEEVTGYSSEELAHKLAFELIPEDERPKMIAAINDAYEKKYVEVEAHLKRKDDAVIPYRWSGAPIRDEKQNDVGIIGIGWDLTEQLKMHAEISAQQLRERAIFDSTSDLIFVKDRDGRYSTANAPMLAFMGKQVNEIIGKTDFDFFPKNYAEKYRSDDAEVAQTRMQKRIEEESVDAAGNVSWFETIKTPLYDKNEFIGIVGVARDITDRKKRESDQKTIS